MSRRPGLYLVDDEAPALRRLQRLVETLGTHEVLGSTTDPGQTIADCRRLQPEAVLLDVEMPGTDGVQLAQGLCRIEPSPALIFVTAFENYAVDAFELAAADYLVKPVRPDRLARALARIGPRGPGDSGEAMLSARLGDRIQNIPVAEVRALLAESKYTCVHYPGGQALIDDSLVSLEERFAGRFVRVHRNALVCRRYLRGLHRDADGRDCVELDGVDCQPEVSRRNLPAVRQELKQAAGRK